MFSDHNGIKLKISKRNKYEKYINKCKLYRSVLNNHWSKEKSQKILEKTFEINENKDKNIPNSELQ